MPLVIRPVPVYQKQGRSWLQRTELNPYTLLDGHGMSGMNWPAPALTQIRAQSTLQRAGSEVIDIVEGDSDLAAFTIPTRIAAVRNYLMAIVGEFVNVQLLTGPDGTPTQYGAAKYGLGWVLCKRSTATTDQGASADNAGEGVPLSFEVPFNAVMGPIPIDWTTPLQRKTTPDVQIANGIVILPPLKTDDNARRILPGEVAFVVHDAVGAGTAKVYYTTDGFRTAMVVTAVDPFGADIDLKAVTGYGDKKDPRVIVAADTQAALPAQVKFSDDFGATYSAAINLGAVNADQAHKMWTVDASHIYGVGGAAGSSKIWESNDGAASFAETDPALAQPLRDIEVVGTGFGIVVGDSNVIARALDFDDWSSITGPSGGAGDALLCVGIKPSTSTVFIGNDAGELYVSQDQGDTWADVTANIDVTPTSINHIKFDRTGEFGFMEVTITGDRVTLRTTDGGNSWKQYGLGNGGLSDNASNDLQVFGPNEVVIVGAVATTAAIRVAQSNFDGGRLQ